MYGGSFVEAEILRLKSLPSKSEALFGEKHPTIESLYGEQMGLADLGDGVDLFLFKSMCTQRKQVVWKCLRACVKKIKTEFATM